jgi:hypothetical protein
LGFPHKNMVFMCYVFDILLNYLLNSLCYMLWNNWMVFVQYF